MSHLVAYIDAAGNLKIEDSDDWLEGLEVYDEDQLDDDLNPFDDAEQWLDENDHGDVVEFMSKGDRDRTANKSEYAKNHEEVFGERKHVCRKFLYDKETKTANCYHCGSPEIGKR